MLKEQEDIILKVKDLYIKYGIKSVSMDDVARECGISKKTLYQYFKDKEELVEKVFQFLIDANKSVVDNMLNQNLDAITEMFEIHLFMDDMARRHSHVVEYDLKKYYPHVFEQIIDVRRQRIYDIGISNMKKGLKEGYYRPEINIEIIVKLALLRFESSIDTCIFTNEELLSQDFFKELFIYHIRGIGTAKGISKMESLLKTQ